ncbi:sulfatase [Halococcus saccharolyticus]|nr:sulfatase [Halococcus saccharolyticus]
MDAEKRNVVLVTMDSLRADHCSFMGYERETTPTLDAMAAEGVVFENAIASGVPTIASMTSVMTGTFSLASPEIGLNEEQREQVTSRKTLAEALSAAGYATGAVSPNPPASSYFGFDGGFDWFEDFLHEDRGTAERAWNRIFRRSIEGGGAATSLRLARNLVRREETLRPWDDYYDLIHDWCERAPEPYFLWVLLLDPHHPWLPPAASRQWSSRGDLVRSFGQYWRMLNAGWEPDFGPDERQRFLDLYDDSIRHADRFLHRLQADLRDDDPVFVVHADHGEEFGEHGRYGHQPHLYESLVHVPLVIANAGRQETVDAPVPLRSIPTTIAELAEATHRFPAPSLHAAAERPWTISKVLVGDDRRTAIRTRDHKFIRDPNRRELYDLRLDPDEQVNVVDDHGELASVFEAILANHTATEREKRSIDDTTALVEGTL